MVIVSVTMRRSVVTVLLVSLLALHTSVVAAAAPQDANSAFIARVLELTNVERQKAGLGPLAMNSQLSDAAQIYSQVLAGGDCFEHTCGPVPRFADRIGQAGYDGWSALGENIAAGYPTPEAVVAGWMASPGHRENILSPNYNEIGIGLVSGGGKFGTYWTQEFGSRPGAAFSAAAVAPAPADDSQASASHESDGGSSAG
jgi:uncharacterized protein YkwD